MLSKSFFFSLEGPTNNSLSVHLIRERSRGIKRHFIGCISQVVLLTQDYLGQYEHITHDGSQSVWFHLAAVSALHTVALRGSVGEPGAQ